MAVDIEATSLNGWFKGRWCFLLSLCNMCLSKSFFLDDSRRPLPLFSVLPNCVERVHLFLFSLCLLAVYLYTKLGMVSYHLTAAVRSLSSISQA